MFMTAADIFDDMREQSATRSTRLLDLSPASFDEDAGTVDATLSRGTPVKRFYGVEKLEISREAVDLSRVSEGGVPVIDSHRQDSIDNILGKVVRVWIEKDALLGRLKFAQTKRGLAAAAMVKRGEIRSVSIGYTISEWEITDGYGNVVPQERVRWDDELTFTAKRWTLAECSLVSVPADAAATLRSFDGDQVYPQNELQDTLVRMQMRHALTTGICDDRDIPRGSIFVLDDIRQRMLSRQSMIDAQAELHPYNDGEIRMARELLYYRSSSV
jgi:phage head maturation protease